MKRLAYVVVALSVVVGACSKKEAEPTATPQAPQAQAQAQTKPEEPAEAKTQADSKAPGTVELPAPGTAPPAQPLAKETPMWNAPIKTLQGKDGSLADYKGKALLLVNVASKCGLTPQYSALEALQKKYGPQGFTVIGFPCNQFGGQEPGTAEEIETFCSTTYGVTFPMMEKIEVNGPGRHAIYQELTQIADASGHTGDIRWNFEKFVVSADGTHVTRFDPRTTPDDPKVIAAIEAALPR
jgi:glutathione peroxidase